MDSGTKIFLGVGAAVVLIGILYFSKNPKTTAVTTTPVKALIPAQSSSSNIATDIAAAGAGVALISDIFSSSDDSDNSDYSIAGVRKRRRH